MAVKKKIKRKSEIFSVINPTYGLGILVCLNPTPEELKAAFKKHNLTDKISFPEDYQKFPGLVCTDRSTTAVLIMRDWPEKASNYNTLQHEIFHACDMLLRNIGFELNCGSMEAWAYFIGFTTEKIYNVLWDKKYR